MKEHRNSKGITLITLIVTVIIMLILAGIGLNLAIGEHGIFRKTEEGAQLYQNSADDDRNKLNSIDKKIENIVNRIDGNKPTIGKEFKIKFEGQPDELIKDEEGYFKEGIKMSVYKYADIEADGNIKISKEFEPIQFLETDTILDEYLTDDLAENPLNIDIAKLKEVGIELVNIIEKQNVQPLLTTTTKPKERKEIVFQSKELDNKLWFVVVENGGFLGESYDYIAFLGEPCMVFGATKNGKGKTLEDAMTHYNNQTLEFTTYPIIQKEIKYAGLKIVNTVNNYQTNQGEAIFAYEIEAQKNGKKAYSDVVYIKQNESGTQEITIDNQIPVGSQVTVKEVYSGGIYNCTSEQIKNYMPMNTTTKTLEFINEYNHKTLQTKFAILNFNFDKDMEEWGVELDNNIEVNLSSWTAHIAAINEEADDKFVRIKYYTAINSSVNDFSEKWEQKEDGRYYKEVLTGNSITDAIGIKLEGVPEEPKDGENFKLIIIIEATNALKNEAGEYYANWDA